MTIVVNPKCCSVATALCAHCLAAQPAASGAMTPARAAANFEAARELMAAERRRLAANADPGDVLDLQASRARAGLTANAPPAHDLLDAGGASRRLVANVGDERRVDRDAWRGWDVPDEAPPPPSAAPAGLTVNRG